MVIDGLNVIRLLGAADPRVELLLEVALHHARAGDDVLCISDANTRHELGEKQGADARAHYERLLRELPDHFVECPAKTQADPLLLAEAARHDARVISNDLFAPYREEHPWVGDNRRFLRAKVIRDRLYLGERPIDLGRPAATLVEELVAALG